MSELKDYIQVKNRQCKICHFLKDNEDVAKQIREIGGLQPTKFASAIAAFITHERGYAVTAQNVHDHFRRGHAARSILDESV